MRYRSRYCFVLLPLALFLVAALAPPAETPPPFLIDWGTTGTAEGQFSYPEGVAVDALGNVYVTDIYNHRIQKFDSNGNFLRTWGWGVVTGSAKFETCTSSCRQGSSGGGTGQFDTPRSVAVDSLSLVYVVDQYNHRIQKFDSHGNFLRMWGWNVDVAGGYGFEICTSSCQKGTSGDGAGQFEHPLFVAAGAMGKVYVADVRNHRIQEFDNSGAFVRTWGWDVDVAGGYGFEICTSSCQEGASGGGAGQFNAPYGIAVDSSGNVYVADNTNHRIQKFGSNGAFLLAWGWGVAGGSGLQICTSSCFPGIRGSGTGQLDNPQGLSVDHSDNVYVVDALNHRIQKFGSGGTWLVEWGTSGAGDNQFNYPFDVTVDARGKVYVGDTENFRISKFGFPWVEIFLGEPELPGGR